MSTVSPEILTSSILETPQQYLAGAEITKDLEHQLGRACTAHSFTAAREFLNTDSKTSVGELIDFVVEFGAKQGTDLYEDGVGWSLVKLADLLRIEGHQVITQNLNIGLVDHDTNKAFLNGRVKTGFEKSRLTLYADSGGRERTRWLQAIQSTLLGGGVVASSIEIPLLSGQGYGLHSVVIIELDEDNQTIKYFDPDYYNTHRFGENSPQIERIDDKKLLYRRPVVDHLAAMTGEVTHVFPSKTT